MKYAVVLAICLAAIFSSSYASQGGPGGPGQGGPGGSNGPQPGGDVISDLRNCVAQKISNNATLLSNLITALNNANLGQYVITVNGSQTVNFTSLFQNYFTVLPAISSYFYTYILPSNTKITPAFNATLTIINLLKTNQTVLTEFIGYLYINDLFSFSSGSQGSYVVDFTAVVANAQASRVLDGFIAGYVARTTQSQNSQSFGPFGHKRR